MVFTSSPWWSEIAVPVPDTKLVGDFVIERNNPLYDWSEDKPVLVCAQSGKSYKMKEIDHNVTLLAASLAKALGWSPNKGAPEDKVVGICSFNTIDLVPLSWAIHRIGGTCLLLHPTSSAADIATLMRKANCKVLFTCEELLAVCQDVLTTMKIDLSNLFLLEVPGDAQPSSNGTETNGTEWKQTVSQLITDGEDLPPLEKVKLQDGESRHRVAYLCPTSGTSGYQKLAQITHANVMTNIIQALTLEKVSKGRKTEVSLGILPLSHAYGLVLLQAVAWRGDTVILHSRFDMQATLRSIQQYRIERLYLVPAILAAFANTPVLFKLADLSSVKTVVCGSAPLSAEMAGAMKRVRPDWDVLPGYGLTEAAVIVSFTSQQSIFPGSAGSLLPNVEARLLAADGSEINDFGVSGDLYLRSPSIMKGYLGESAVDSLAFDSDGWLITGDVACIKKNTDGVEHLFIVDRKKDIMKVKGIQVPPVEIEGQLLNHPAVDEAAVIAINDNEAGERPFAFVVRSRQVMTDVDEKSLKQAISQHIQTTMSEPFWLRKNIKFVENIPKSHSGKALKFKLKELITNSGQ
uniref:Ligase n=1 Tax=Phialomyces arenicola TaxID=168477 RepID=A0A6H0XBC5_9EURO|nr:Ligase [Phialomyces arenicola]